ncbi:hypothetical protein GCM10027200_10750 [Lentzea nigeriaca]
MATTAAYRQLSEVWAGSSVALKLCRILPLASTPAGFPIRPGRIVESTVEQTENPRVRKDARVRRGSVQIRKPRRNASSSSANILRVIAALSTKPDPWNVAG